MQPPTFNVIAELGSTPTDSILLRHEPHIDLSPYLAKSSLDSDVRAQKNELRENPQGAQTILREVNVKW